MEETSTILTFPDALYTEQAAYVAENTRLTEREAEAYLRWAHTPDADGVGIHATERKHHKDIAKDMGVEKSTFSRHLNNAQEKLKGDESLRQSFNTFLMTTDVGGTGGHNRQVLGSTRLKNGFLLLTTTEFFDREEYNFPSKYKAHLLYSEKAPEIDFDTLPEDTIHYDKHSVFTIQSSGVDHFITSTLAYIDALDAMEVTDIIKAADALEEAFHVEIDNTTSEASAILQDASASFMDQMKQ